MVIFGKKTAELQKQVAELTQKIEKKGYYGTPTPEEQAKFLKQFYQYLPNINLVDFGATNFNDYIKYYKNNAIVYGVVGTTIAKAVGELFEYIELQDENDNVVENHWSINVLKSPNDLESGRAFITAWAILRMLTGNSLISLEKTLGSKREIREMYNIPANQFDIISKGAINPIEGFKLKTDAYMKPTLLPDDVIFSRDYNPDITTLFGLSPLQAAANFVQIIEKSMQRQNGALENGGVGRLITPQMYGNGEYGSMTPIEKDKFEREANGKYNGNYTKMFAVPVDVHELGDTPADLAILDTSRFAINALCFVYGISVDVFLGQAKYNNAKEAKKATYQQAAIPLVNLFLEDVQKGFGKLDVSFKSGALKFILNTDKVEVLRDSVTEMVSAYTAANASINEKRDLLGLSRIEEPYADKPIVNLGVTFGDPYEIDISENNQGA